MGLKDGDLDGLVVGLTDGLFVGGFEGMAVGNRVCTGSDVIEAVHDLGEKWKLDD